MSTRANIKFIDGNEELWFYRHSDGYPEETMPTLEKLIKAYKENRIRKNISQSSGWLIVLGYLEYLDPINNSDLVDWKVGAYEPTTGRHEDIEYLYVFDLGNSELRIYKTSFSDEIADQIINTKSLKEQ